ncbi:MAG: hypothetical protein Q8K55_16580 [Gemmatimonadaceae bacterium]|nr:hypothetical protein [Gemmatimonadaceae bacterium]
MRADVAIEYEIDGHNHIVSANRAWFDEAQTAGDTRLADESVVGRDLWELIQDSSTRHLYETMISRARVRAQPLGFRFRCDTPDRRRLLHMEITPRESGHVAFEVRLIASQPREAVELLQIGRAHSEALIRMCGWCKRVPMPGDGWVEVEQALDAMHLFEASGPLPAISHGICPECLDKMIAIEEDADVAFGGLPAQ